MKIIRILTGALALVISANAQTVPQLRAAISGTTQYKESALSPDGRWLGWSVTLRNSDQTESKNSDLWLLDLNKPGAQPRKLGAARLPRAEHSLAFSPDSKRVAFLSDADKSGQLQLYTQSVTGLPARKLTSLKGFLAGPRWSPDGKRLGLLFTENAPRAAGPLEPSTKDSGPVEEQVFEQRLNIVDLATAAVKAVTPADTYVYEYDWSPDSALLAYTAAKGNGDNNWWVAQLFTVTLATGDNRQIHKPALQIANPRWSPDGKSIAYIGGIMSDEGATGGDIFSVSAAGNAQAVNLTPNRKSSPAWLTWLPSGKILFTETIDGATALATLNPSDKGTETLWKSDESIKAGDDALAVSSDGKVIAAIRNSWSQAPEVWAGPVATGRSAPTRMTH